MENQDYNRKNIENIIESIVDQEGIQPSYKGFKYINEAVYLILEDGEKLDAITKEVYGEIARKHKTSITSVERTIRFAIQKTSLKFTSFSYSYQNKPIQTNKTFIANIAKKVRNCENMQYSRKIHEKTL